MPLRRSRLKSQKAQAAKDSSAEVWQVQRSRRYRGSPQSNRQEPADQTPAVVPDFVAADESSQRATSPRAPDRRSDSGTPDCLSKASRESTAPMRVQMQAAEMSRCRLSFRKRSFPPWLLSRLEHRVVSGSGGEHLFKAIGVSDARRRCLPDCEGRANAADVTVVTKGEDDRRSHFLAHEEP